MEKSNGIIMTIDLTMESTFEKRRNQNCQALKDPCLMMEWLFHFCVIQQNLIMHCKINVPFSFLLYKDFVIFTVSKTRDQDT